MSVLFDGTDDYVRTPSGDVFSMNGATKFTVSFWVKVTTANAFRALFIRNFSSSSRFVIQSGSTSGGVGDDDEIVVAVSNGSETRAYTTGQNHLASGGPWKHICVVFDGDGEENEDKAKLYVNGVLQTLTFSGTFPTTLMSTNDPTYFGAFGTTNELTGRLAEFGVWSGSALNSTQVAALASGDKPDTIPNNLVFYWSAKSSFTPEVGSFALTVGGDAAIDADHPAMNDGGDPGDGFQPAWARGSNVIIQPGR